MKTDTPHNSLLPGLKKVQQGRQPTALFMQIQGLCYVGPITNEDATRHKSLYGILIASISMYFAWIGILASLLSKFQTIVLWSQRTGQTCQMGQMATDVHTCPSAICIERKQIRQPRRNLNNELSQLMRAAVAFI